MPFRNRIRLPFYLTRPQFPTEDNVTRLANGVKKTLSSIVRKVYEGETDELPKEIHERLIIALKHDDVTIEGYRYLGGVSLDGGYEIEWNGFLDYPLGKAEFKAEATPFNYSNDNCQTCEEATQLSLEDDTITGLYESLEEGEQYEHNVFENDSICCHPITAEVIVINSTFVSEATIDSSTGIVSLTMQPEYSSATNVNLLTYRVTCPNGAYDEADVFANVFGTAEECMSPENLSITDIETSTAQAIWDAPTPAPDSYHWELFLASDLINPLITGDTTDLFVNLTGLSPSTGYRFYVRGTCDDGIGTFVYSDFTTESAGGGGGGNENCGEYQLTNNGLGFANVSYLDCNGVYQNIVIPSGETRIICALQESIGDPVDLIAQDDNVDIAYFDLC